MKPDAIAVEASTPGAPLARNGAPSPRFIVIERRNGAVHGDTGAPYLVEYSVKPRRLTPIRAVQLIESMICDHPGYGYRKVARDDPAAMFDVYRPAPDYPQDTEVAQIERDCTHAAALARIYPRCCFCRRLLEYHPWQYGHDTAPVRENGRCCDRCYVRRIKPARLRAEGFYTEAEIAAECEREAAMLARD